MIKKILSLTLATCLFACQGGKQGSSTTNSDSLATTTVYKGTLPCGDCPGIETSLTLLEGGRASYRTYYIGEDEGLIEEQGTYTLADSTLKLMLPSDTLKFRMKGENLIYLDFEGKPYEGSLAPYYILYKRRPFDYLGEYMLEGEAVEGGYEQSLNITPEGGGYRVKFSASLIKGKEGCSFEGMGQLRRDTLFVSLGKPNEGVEMYIAPRHDQLGLDVYTTKDEDRHALMYYCSGGGSLAGSYLKTGVSAGAMGIFRKGQTIADLLHEVPMAQIELTEGLGKFADDRYDDYHILTTGHKALFTITPKQRGDANSVIERILVHSSLYRTAKGINCNSTLGEIRRAYKISRAEPSESYIILSVDEINAQFSFPKGDLPESWWNEAEQRIELSLLPDTLRPSSFILWWTK